MYAFIFVFKPPSVMNAVLFMSRMVMSSTAGLVDQPGPVGMTLSPFVPLDSAKLLAYSSPR